MMSTAFSLAVLTTSGFMLIYSKLPRKVRKFIEKHSLVADLLALIMTYHLLGGTLTALIAASLCGIFVSVLLHVSANEQDFLFLFDLKDAIKKQLNEAKKAAQKFGQAYREKKLATEEMTA